MPIRVDSARARLRAPAMVAGLFILFLGVTWAIPGPDLGRNPDMVCYLAFNSGAVLDDLPVASTMRQMQKGLSELAPADIGPGMFFVWPDTQIREFWMKDTYAPLSLAFIGSNGEVLEIIDLEPGSLEPRGSTMPVREAIEVPAGDFERLGVVPGDVIIGRHCRPINE